MLVQLATRSCRLMLLHSASQKVTNGLLIRTGSSSELEGGAAGGRRRAARLRQCATPPQPTAGKQRHTQF